MTLWHSILCSEHACDPGEPATSLFDPPTGCPIADPTVTAPVDTDEHEARKQ